MNIKTLTASGFCVAAAITSICVLTSNRAFAEPSTHQAKKAKPAPTVWSTKPVGTITPWAAMDIAAKNSGGKAFQAVYEFDEGNWIYGVMVVKNHKLFEVEVNASTGKIGETEGVTVDGEAKEMKSELNSALKTAG